MQVIRQRHLITHAPEGMATRIERAGRICYKSEDKITADSAKLFIAMINEKGHHSVLEHESIQVLFITDRGVSHELVRHRIASYSQESTRYCDYGEGDVTFIIPVWMDDRWIGKWDDRFLHHKGDTEKLWMHCMAAAELHYQQLRERKWSPQQARSVLPNSLKTEIVMTANLREWLHVFKLRTSKAAHPQMRSLMIPVLQEFQKMLPEVFGVLGVPL